MEIEDIKDDDLKCDDCGTTKDVKATTCPYAEEIYGKIIHVNLCKNCKYDRAMEI